MQKMQKIVDPELKEFISERPDVHELRENYPELAHLFSGTFRKKKPNVYEFNQGTIASWELSQPGADKNPTYGMIPVRRTPSRQEEGPTDTELKAGICYDELTSRLPGVWFREKPPFEFRVQEFNESLTVLEGILIGEVNGQEFRKQRGQSIYVPTRSVLNLEAIDFPVMYICHYTKSNKKRTARIKGKR